MPMDACCSNYSGGEHTVITMGMKRVIFRVSHAKPAKNETQPRYREFCKAAGCQLIFARVGQSSVAGSPPPAVPRARQTSRLTLLEMNRAEPSQKAAFTPVGWRLRAAMLSSLFGSGLDGLGFWDGSCRVDSGDWTALQDCSVMSGRGELGVRLGLEVAASAPPGEAAKVAAFALDRFGDGERVAGASPISAMRTTGLNVLSWAMKL